MVDFRDKEIICDFNSIREHPKAERRKEKLKKSGKEIKVFYAFRTLICDAPLDDDHWSNNTPKTLFTIIAANNTGLKNMYKLVSAVNTREKIILDPTEVKANSEGLLFAMLESGDFNHSESGEIRQSESINKNQSPGLYLLN